MGKTKERVFVDTSEGLLSIKQIAERTGLSVAVVRNRYHRGMRGDEILRPKSLKNKPVRIEYQGKERTLAEISAMTGLSPDTIYQRFKKRGMRGSQLNAPLAPKIDADSVIGAKFNKLTILSVLEPVGGHRRCICKCDCGNIKEYSLYAVKKGGTKSCGCIRNEVVIGTHHMSKTKEHKAWRHIKERCLNPNSKHYSDYGGRGISVCEQWVNDFERFFADMGKAPSSRHSIDRIDVNGNYEPGNCRWATRTQQNRNRRITIYITYNGKKKSTREWEDLLGLRMGRLRAAYLRGVDMTKYIDMIRQGRTKIHIPSRT